jgi:MFS family permease
MAEVSVTSSKPYCSCRSPWLVWACVATGVVIVALDGTMLSLALPNMAKALHTSLQDTQWVMLAYMLSISVLLLPIGRLSEHFGEHRLYVLGVFLYGLAAVCCGVCPTVQWLIVCRLLQGIGAAMLMAMGPVMLSQVFGKNLGRPMAGMNVVVAVASTIAPLLAGWVLSHLSWHWLFWMSLPVTASSVLFGVLILKPYREHSAVNCEPFDWQGSVASMLILGATLYLLTYGLRQPGAWLLNGSLTLAIMLVGVWFWRHIHRFSDPILSLGALKDRAVQITCLSSMSVFCVTSVMTFLLPFYFQEALKLSPKDVGLMLIIFPIGLAITAPLAGALSDKYGSRWLSLFSMFGLALVALGMAWFSPSTPLLWIGLQQFIFGLVSGFFHSPNNRALMLALEGAGSVSLSGGALALVRTLGTAFGITLVGLVFLITGGALTQANLVFFTGLQVCVWLSIAFLLLISAFQVPRCLHSSN